MRHTQQEGGGGGGEGGEETNTDVTKLSNYMLPIYHLITIHFLLLSIIS